MKQLNIFKKRSFDFKVHVLSLSGLITPVLPILLISFLFISEDEDISKGSDIEEVLVFWLIAFVLQMTAWTVLANTPLAYSGLKWIHLASVFTYLIYGLAIYRFYAFVQKKNFRLLISEKLGSEVVQFLNSIKRAG